MLRKYGLLYLIILMMLSACGQGVPTGDGTEGKLAINVSILPQAYFVERIAGDLASVHVMVSPGDDPHLYEPTPNQMRALSEANLYISIGVEFENAWLPRFKSANPNLTIVDSTIGVDRIPTTISYQGEEAGEPDPHIWLSPVLVKVQAQNITQGLIRVDPTHADIYQANLTVFLNDIDDLDADIRKRFEGLEGRHFMAFHPAWGYFADAYGLEMIVIEAGGQEPGAEGLAKTIDLAQQYGIDVIFSQKESSSKNAEAIAAEIGARVVTLDPLARDWLENMQTMADAFEDALK